MDPVRSSLGGGLAAALTLLVFLLLTDVLLMKSPLTVLATFTGMCSAVGPPYCELGTLTAVVLRFLWFGLFFIVGWPLLFAGFTWGLPGESGLTHGVVFGLILWSGYAGATLYGITLGGQTFSENLQLLLAVTLLAYSIYGLVLGIGYDHLAEHQTFLSEDQNQTV